MPKTIRGFIEIPENSNNNAAGAVAALGELSQDARTYSRNKQYLAADAEPGIELVVFSAVDAADAPVFDLTGADVLPALTVINQIRNQFTNDGNLVDWLTTNADASLSGFTVTNIIVENSINMPGFIRFVHTDTDVTTYELWISNAEFLTGYPTSEAQVVPPILPITALYQGHTETLAAMAGWTRAMEYQALNDATVDAKPTTISTYELKWNDPANLANQFQTTWVVLGYGPEGTRTDIVLEAVRDYLTANSPYTVDQWKEYLPDIRTLDVFTVIPLWDNVALPVGSNLSSLNRPVIRMKRLASVLTSVLTDHTDTELMTFGETLPALFRNTPVLVMPGLTNDPTKQSFTALYPDYTLIALNDQNANRLTSATQSIITTLDMLLRRAEVDDGTQSLPSGVTRNLIGGRRYLEKSDASIVYRCVTKSSYEEVVV